MPLQATSGAASYDAFGGGVAAVPNYIEDVFSTYLYTGTGASQTINNGIDLAGKGGLVWIKSRAVAGNHFLMDTARGFNTGVSPAAAYKLSSDSTSAQGTSSELTAFNSNGFTLGSSWVMNDDGSVSGGNTYASWTFRKQPKFFDVVTWTGDDTSNRQIAHNLGSAPGCIILKSSSNASSWFVYHRSTGDDNVLFLNTTDAVTSSPGSWATSSTTFTLGNANFNISGRTYVAYLFAHNAGGFGLTGTDNVISCGSFTTDGSGNATVDLGYEPQWVLVKNTSSNVTGGWNMIDNMRGWTTINGAALFANATDAEFTSSLPELTSTGFNWTFNNAAFASTDYIYIAIRRGPMKVPTSGTSVFAVNLAPDTSTAPLTWNTNSTVDSVLTKRNLSNTNGNNIFVDRLRGNSANIYTNGSSAESSNANITDLTISNGYIQKLVSTGGSGSAVTYAFSRAPSFFDEVCYSGTSANRTVTHNLGVAPELILVRIRNEASGWRVYASPLTATSYLILNQTNESSIDSTVWNNTTPTSSVFSLGTDANVNGPYNYVAYLFATCTGVSKVGSYTGNGSSQTINCGFTGGARFVMIKATSTTGDWMVADSARGIVSGNDPYLELNNTNAEVTGEDWLDTNSTGFVVNEVSGSNANTNGVTYIYLAIA